MNIRGAHTQHTHIHRSGAIMLVRWQPKGNRSKNYHAVHMYAFSLFCNCAKQAQDTMAPINSVVRCCVFVFFSSSSHISCRVYLSNWGHTDACCAGRSTASQLISTHTNTHDVCGVKNKTKKNEPLIHGICSIRDASEDWAALPITRSFAIVSVKHHKISEYFVNDVWHTNTQQRRKQW